MRQKSTATTERRLVAVVLLALGAVLLPALFVEFGVVGFGSMGDGPMVGGGTWGDGGTVPTHSSDPSYK